jgi:predicted Zn-dependent peptidase
MKIYFPNVKYYKIFDDFYMIYLNTKTNIFFSSITINIGSINEDSDQQGLAHFFEHMIFKGTKTSTSEDILLTLDSIGANYNASTSYEETQYYISGKTSDYSIILNTLLDIFLNPAFPEQDIANEINVVLEEYRMMQDNHNKLTIFELMKLIYLPSDPRYSHPVIGIESNIKNITRDNLIQFHSKYTKGSKILSIIGSVEEDLIFKILSQVFGTKPIKWKPEFNGLDSKLTIPYLKNKTPIKYSIIQSPQIKQTLVFIGFRSIANWSKWSYVSDIIENILTGGMSSRLFVLLRNKLGLTYYQNSWNKTFSPHGFFCISYGVQPQGLEISLTNVLELILGFGESDITQAEMTKAKNTLETSILFNLQTPTDIGSYIIDYVISKKDPKQIKNLHKKITQVTPTHVKKFAKKVFVKSNLFVVLNGPNQITKKSLKNLIDQVTD